MKPYFFNCLVKIKLNEIGYDLIQVKAHFYSCTTAVTLCSGSWVWCGREFELTSVLPPCYIKKKVLCWR